MQAHSIRSHPPRIKKFRSTFTPSADSSNSAVNLSVEIWITEDQQPDDIPTTELDDPALAAEHITKFAVLAHPYGRLGGSSHDPVIRRVAFHLASLNWMVVLFDARGIGGSTGRASWTSLPEVRDFQAILDQLLKPMILRSISRSLESRTGLRDWTLLRGGYSHGALVASASTPIFLSADAPKLKTPLLLISYPLSYIWALTSFNASHFEKALQAQLTNSDEDLLIIHGDSDQFTSQKAYRKWLDRLKSGLSPTSLQKNNLSTFEAPKTDHFWSGSYSTLCQAIDEWLSKTSIS
ncbi:Alpha/Beta hydrolase protein [Melampsora americana]|nr:Alpha/Beta hydrolase protein [Melampsora americana]